MTVGKFPLSWSLSGVKQTSLVAAHMSAFDPKRTFVKGGAAARSQFALDQSAGKRRKGKR
jgi:hypothetical protein